jgi:hypothetical protein
VTESDWLSSTDPLAILSFLRDRGPVSERKLRLAGCACAGPVARLLEDRRLEGLAALSERTADGEDVGGEMAGILTALQADPVGQGEHAQLNGRVGVVVLTVHPPGHSLYHRAFGWLLTAAAWARCPTAEAGPDAGDISLDPAWRGCWDEGVAGQAAVLRDIFGNPFRPLHFDSSWHTEAVVALARGVYEEKAFERMPVLGDALEDAGCDSPQVLEHCRSAVPHWKGCWCIDMALGLS